MVKITGQWLNEILIDGGPDCTDYGWRDLEVRSLVIKKTRTPTSDTGDDTRIDDGGDVTYSACVENCIDEESCKHAADEGLELCPNTDPPEHWRNPVIDEALRQLHGGPVQIAGQTLVGEDGTA